MKVDRPGRTITIALAGNPNSGKTSLFNALTGANQQVGNWPGITVEKKTGRFVLNEATYEVIDLPGTYSLEPGTPEQTIAGDYLKNTGADVIVNVVDVTNLTRNMLLTLQLMDIGAPMVMALNFIDEAEKKGLKADTDKLSGRLDFSVVPISASRSSGIDKLKAAIADAVGGKAPKRLLPCDRSCSRCSSGLEGFSCIDSTFLDCVTGGASSGAVNAIDRIVLNRWLALPFFALAMTLVFYLTFGPLTGRASNLIDSMINVRLLEAVKRSLDAIESPSWLTGLLSDGAIGGAGAVLVFLPQIAMLFFLLSLLEGTGYMARAAFVMDRAMSWLGLSGKSFVILLMGFGCTVPAIMSTRILEDENERKLTAVVAPFMSCSARMPIYVMIAGAFFGSRAGIAAASMYFTGILVMVLSALLLSSTVFKTRSRGSFVLEMPPYRMPRLNYLIIATWHKTRDFIIRAGTLIVLVSSIVWALGHFDLSFAMVSDPSESMLASLGRLITPILSPLGFGDWRVSVALISGIAAKELVASTLTLLAGTGAAAMRALGINTASSLSLMVFALLYIPCSATIVVMARELGGFRKAMAAVAYGFIVAWASSFIVYRLCFFLMNGGV